MTITQGDVPLGGHFWTGRARYQRIGVSSVLPVDTENKTVGRALTLIPDEPVDEIEGAPAFNASGSKYLRAVPCMIDGKIDVYAVLDAFAVTCPARQHAIKKLLCSGLRDKGSAAQDLSEARDAIDRAIQMERR